MLDDEQDEEEDSSSMSEEEHSNAKSSTVNGNIPKEQSPLKLKKGMKTKLAGDKLKASSNKETKMKNNESKTINLETSSSKKKSLQGGVVIEDLKEGHGPAAKSGKFVTVSIYFYWTVFKKLIFGQHCYIV